MDVIQISLHLLDPEAIINMAIKGGVAKRKPTMHTDFI